MLSLFPCPSPLLQLDLSVVTKRFNLLSQKVFRKGFGCSCLGSTRYRSVYGTEPGEATGYVATSVLEQSKTGVETGTRNGWDLEKEGTLAWLLPAKMLSRIVVHVVRWLLRQRMIHQA